MNLTNAILQLVVMALVTYLVRMLPMTLFTKKITSRFLRSFLYYVPYAVLGAMTFPAIFFSAGGIISGLVGTVVALVLAFCRKSLLTVAVCACAAVFVTNLLLTLL
ncbi:MAG: AzlD domain-containing protein [Oscillospiraceae bacterium]|nr:AzlD domain-containing protein [Oscillospiraceae bacterium]